MKVKIIPGKLRGRITAMPSKSHAHRVLIAQKLAQLQGSPHNNPLFIPEFSRDITATKSCLAQLDLCTAGSNPQAPLLDCGESGSTLRFLIPVAMALTDKATFAGSGKLPQRPISPLKEEMENHGCRFTMNPDISLNRIISDRDLSGHASSVCDSSGHDSSDSAPSGCDSFGKIPSDGSSKQAANGSDHNHAEPAGICRITGRVQPGEYRLPGNISSQFITGLLFALPILDGDSTLHLTTKLESAGYVDLTLDVLRDFGIDIIIDTNDNGLITYNIRGNQKFCEPDNLSIEGDWSNTAFWLACGALGGDITCDGLKAHSSQRDREILTVMQNLGTVVQTQTSDNDMITITCRPPEQKISDNIQHRFTNDDTLDDTRKFNTLSGIDLNAAQIPDLVPVIASIMAAADGHSQITGAERLKIKESDRLATVCDFLNKLGADVGCLEDGLSINGKSQLAGGTVESHNDHRIAMAAAVSSCVCREPVIIENAEAVKKSYPDFFDDFKKLGGIVMEIS